MKIIVRDNPSVFLEEVAVRSMHCQRKNLQGEGTWGNQDHFAYALHVLLTPAEHMLRPSFVSLMEPETGGYAVLDDIQDTGS